MIDDGDCPHTSAVIAKDPEPLPAPEPAPAAPTRLRGAWAAAALAVVLIAGIVVAALLLSPGSDSPSGAAPAPAPLPSPRTITRHGVTYDVGPVRPVAAGRDPSRPTVVEIFVDRTYDPRQPICSQLRPSARVVTEDENSVQIATFAYRKPTQRKTYACYEYESSNYAPYAKLTVQLRQPLGDRTLVDVTSGADIGIVVGLRPPTPGYVPAGYRFTFSRAAGIRSDFIALRQYAHGSESVEIRTQSATAWARLGTVIDHADVAGHDATISDEKWERCVAWTVAPGVVQEVCSQGSNHAFLSEATLLDIARSLH